MSVCRESGWFLVVLAVLAGCEGAQEAPRVRAQVYVEGVSAAPTVSDVGYAVRLTVASMAAADLEFAVMGELHGRRSWSELVIGVAHAHPGHYQGGEVTGAMEGGFEVDWVGGAGEVLGEAELIEGSYTSANFTLVGPIKLAGVARRGEEEVRFEMEVVAPVGRQIVGAPFVAEVRGEGRIGLRFTQEDVQEGDRLFDGVDFVAVAAGASRVVFTEQEHGELYNKLRRDLLSHDHYVLVWTDS